MGWEAAMDRLVLLVLLVFFTSIGSISSNSISHDIFIVAVSEKDNSIGYQSSVKLRGLVRFFGTLVSLSPVSVVTRITLEAVQPITLHSESQ